MAFRKTEEEYFSREGWTNAILFGLTKADLPVGQAPSFRDSRQRLSDFSRCHSGARLLARARNPSSRRRKRWNGFRARADARPGMTTEKGARHSCAPRNDRHRCHSGRASLARARNPSGRRRKRWNGFRARADACPGMTMEKGARHSRAPRNDDGEVLDACASLRNDRQCHCRSRLADAGAIVL